MSRINTIFIALIGLLLISTKLYATHLRAGEIVARRISTTALTYEITLTTYHDEIGGRAASEGQKDVEFCIRPFGGGNGTLLRVSRREPRQYISGATSVNIYRTTYTFASPGRYIISCGIENRNENVVNFNMPSVQTPFYVETTIEINASLGLNRTPVLLNPPLDSARIGQKFCHNPAAFDADGDSLSYRLSVPKQGKPGTCVSSFVSYKDPALGLDPAAKNEALNGQATLVINPRTGELCWDAPAVKGQYNIAFIIEEWRDGIKIGEIVRDMQIIVEDAANKRPLIDPIKDICVEAGQVAIQNMKATDPDGNRVLFTAYGGVFNRDIDGATINLVAPKAAVLTPNNQAQNSPATATIRWETNCDHIRDAPYDVIVKVEDVVARNNVQLASFQSFSIKVVAPKPRTPSLVNTSIGGVSGFNVSWPQYGCQLAGAQVVIYRKEGCTGAKFDPCTAPIGGGSVGYTEVARLPVGATTFADNNKGAGFRRGVQYSYRVQVIFALPQGGSSVLSDESCLDLPAQAPAMTQVTTDSTSTTKGVITVRWSRPINIKPTDLQAPFEYRLFRAEGLTGGTFAQIATIKTDLSGKADTVYTDRNLNTTQNAYRYRVDFYYTFNNTLTLLDGSDAASSVRLANSAAANKNIRLTWQANVPWRNENQVHRIYREDRRRPGVFNRIADVPVQAASTFAYIDDGTDRYLADGNLSIKLSGDSVYCYKVETVGQYDNPRFRFGLINNFSQTLCAAPIDSTGPCPPVLSLTPLNCDNITNNACPEAASNSLAWTYPRTNAAGADCATPVSYRLYFARYPDEKFTLISTITAPTTTFRHEKLDSYAGCYYITAVSRFGTESAKSNVVCNDNCAIYRLPNVITPNNDGKNDVFRPISCPFFVESVQLSIVTRWGTKVFETTDPQINWNGNTSDGKELPAGTYFYQAVVKFKRLSRESESIVVKGWIELIR